MEVFDLGDSCGLQARYKGFTAVKKQERNSVFWQFRNPHGNSLGQLRKAAMGDTASGDILRVVHCLLRNAVTCHKK
eukprot:7238635-Lingulodinium_polyedra.AAC.1